MKQKSRRGAEGKKEKRKIWSCREKFPECQDRLFDAGLPRIRRRALGCWNLLLGLFDSDSSDGVYYGWQSALSCLLQQSVFFVVSSPVDIATATELLFAEQRC